MNLSRLNGEQCQFHVLPKELNVTYCAQAIRASNSNIEDQWYHE